MSDTHAEPGGRTGRHSCARRGPDSPDSDPRGRNAPDVRGDTDRLYDHPMSLAELAEIEARLSDPVSLFAAYAQSDVARLAREVRRLRLVVALSTRDHADLVETCRHALAAGDGGEHDPLFWVRDELRYRGLWRAATARRDVHACRFGGVVA